MSDLVSLDAARFALRLGSEVSDDNLAELLDTAAQIVETRFLGYPIAEKWAEAESVPLPIIHAIKAVAASLYDNRDAPLQNADAIQELVGYFRKPTYA